MQARTTEILEYLDAHRAELDRAVAGIPSELRERRPAPERWSVAEVLEHLAVVEGRLAKLLTDRIETVRAGGHAPAQEPSGAASTFDLARVLDRSRPIVAGEASQPRAGLDAHAAMASLAQQQEQFRELARSTDDLPIEDVLIPHPVFGPMNVREWLLFIGAHEGRHAAQIREIGTQVQA